MFFKKYKYLIVIISILLVISVGFIYYFKVYKKSFEEPVYSDVPESIFLRLQENPDYLIQEKLLSIQSLDLLEYFRTRMLYHSYTDSISPEKNFKEELEKDFPGERGRVLIEIFEVYLRFQKEKNKVYKDEELDGYEKFLKIEMLRVEIFGENLAKLLFPKKDSEKINKFYAYTERYLKKHYTDMPRSKKNHISKARIEIYGDDFDRLYSAESPQRQFELELKINERELSILNEYEKKQAIAEIRKKSKE